MADARAQVGVGGKEVSEARGKTEDAMDRGRIAAVRTLWAGGEARRIFGIEKLEIECDAHAVHQEIFRRFNGGGMIYGVTRIRTDDVKLM